MTPLPETRPSLVLRLRDSQDQQAWETFLEIYQPMIFRLVRQKGIQDADAREVTQEVLMAVASAIDRWDQDPTRGTFRGWLSTITRNLVVNFLIKQSRHPRGIGQFGFRCELDEVAAPEGDVSQVFDLEEKRQIIRWAADQVRLEFRDDHWKAFWLTAIGEQSIPSVAAELGLSIGLVYVTRNRIMKRLRETVESYREQSPGPL